MRYRQAIALLALVGFFVALYLWLHALGIGGALKCGTGSCEVVQTSPWAVFLGLPVALYGVVGYFTLLVVALVSLRAAAVPDRKWSALLAGLASAGFLFTIYLTYLELFVIHAICRWCVGSAVIITAIWIVAVAALRRPPPPSAALRRPPPLRPPRRPLAAVAIAALGFLRRVLIP
jgi:uncharacterized membrane protein